MNDLQAVLVLADISGYTRFMLGSRKSRHHATANIKHLLDTLAGEMREPLRVAEVEGDALFCVATREPVAGGWGDMRDIVIHLTRHLFDRFVVARDTLIVNNPCDCNACQNLGKLEVKLIVHWGEVTRGQIAGFITYSGVDVVVVHRLLKNRVKGRCYALFTRQAFDFLDLGGQFEVSDLNETDEDLGVIPVVVHFPGGAPPRPRLSPVKRMAQAFWLMWRSLLLYLGQGKVYSPDAD